MDTQVNGRFGTALAATSNSVLRRAILASTGNRAVTSLVRRYGMRLGASRFVAGETTEDCLRVAKDLNTQGLRVGVTLLGEHVHTLEETRSAVNDHEAVLRHIHVQRLDANDTCKLTHLGLNVDEGLAYTNVKRVVETAMSLQNTIRIDMEESIYVDTTLDLYRRLRREGLEGVGTVLQAYLYRSMDDLRALLPSRPNLRLVKGAYLEPPSVAFPRKADVDANYIRLIELSLLESGFTAVATHDERVIEHVKEFAAQRGIRPGERFEFQMLYGIRSQLQRDLVREGYPVRTMVPVGTDWYPYLMRRLAERPANLLFFARNVLRR